MLESELHGRILAKNLQGLRFDPQHHGMLLLLLTITNKIGSIVYTLYVYTLSFFFLFLRLSPESKVSHRCGKGSESLGLLFTAINLNVTCNRNLDESRGI